LRPFSNKVFGGLFETLLRFFDVRKLSWTPWPGHYLVSEAIVSLGALVVAGASWMRKGEVVWKAESDWAHL